jgi:hypothetical protein
MWAVLPSDWTSRITRQSQIGRKGVPLVKARAFVLYWAQEYNMSRIETRLNAFPWYRTRIDGVGVHFLHVRSKHPNALPIVMTHGWPGSVVEFIDTNRWSIRRRPARNVSRATMPRRCAARCSFALAVRSTGRSRSQRSNDTTVATKGGYDHARRRPKRAVIPGVKELNEITTGQTDDPENLLVAPACNVESVFGVGSRTPSGPVVMPPHQQGRTHDRSRPTRQISHFFFCIRGAVYTCDKVATQQWDRPNIVDGVPPPDTRD